MRKLFTRYSIIAILAIGFLAFSVPVSSQTVTLGNGTSYNSTTGYPSPYGLWYRTNRNQYIITASELSSLGITAGCNITAIGFNVHATNNHSSVPAWLKIGTTTLSSFPSGTWQTGATQKWSSAGYLTSNGWNTHTFSSNWMYNGGNVLIDMCIGSTSINYTRNASVYYHSATNTVLWNRSDGTDYCSGVGSGNRNSNRPNMQITFIPSTGFDIKMASIDSPYVLGVGKNKVVVTIQNARADTIYWCDLGYKINNNTPVLVNNFSGFPNGKLEAGQSYQYTFSDSLNIPSSGYYTLKAWVNNANDSMPDNDRTNDTITMTVCTGLAGTYTIGATGDYLNFNNAVAALQQCGVAGPVTFNVQQGSYTERVVIPEIVGMDATNTVTFDGQNKSNVTLTYGGTSSTNRTTLIFDGGDYFTFKNMTIKNTGSTYAVAILYKSQAEYNEVSSCNIEVNSSYTSWWTTAIMASASESSSSGTYGNNANFNLIKNNNITGGYCGINFRGISTSTSAVGNQYIGNTFTGQYYYAIYNYYQSADVIQYNNIDIGSRYSSAYAIYRYYSHGAIIDGNIINSGRYGIYTYRENYAYYYGSDSTMITNNMMYDFYNSSYQVGMYLRYSENLKIYHNTIAVDGSYANNYNYSALFFYYCYAPIVKNNILISTGGTMLITSYYYFYSNATIDYNDYIYPNRTTNMF
ncbi:MAG: hypothetical protein U9R42_02820, partial [Bacteroidota bacterium]|nr:hypothetical protein [Bacteroidota bacterium]